LNCGGTANAVHDYREDQLLSGFAILRQDIAGFDP